MKVIKKLGVLYTAPYQTITTSYQYRQNILVWDAGQQICYCSAGIVSLFNKTKIASFLKPAHHRPLSQNTQSLQPFDAYRCAG